MSSRVVEYMIFQTVRQGFSIERISLCSSNSCSLSGTLLGPGWNLPSTFARAFTLWECIGIRLYFRSHLKKENNIIYIKRQRFVFP